MDPNQALADFRDALGKASSPGPNERERHELMVKALRSMEALDEWLCKGGFLPSNWQR